MTPFAKHYQADGSYLWWQGDPGRYVDPRQYQLLDWLAAGGVPDEVAYVAPSLTELKAARTAAIVAECDARLEARWPLAERLAALSGVPLSPPTPEIGEDAAAHMAARDAATAAVAAATDAAGVAAVTPGWPT